MWFRKKENEAALNKSRADCQERTCHFDSSHLRGDNPATTLRQKMMIAQETLPSTERFEKKPKKGEMAEVYRRREIKDIIIPLGKFITIMT